MKFFRLIFTHFLLIRLDISDFLPYPPFLACAQHGIRHFYLQKMIIRTLKGTAQHNTERGNRNSNDKGQTPEPVYG